MRSEPIYIVMGVSGSGKTTLARSLAHATGGDWLDADTFHSSANKARMAQGIPLTDNDRRPWLDRLNAVLREASSQGKRLFLACSALKQKYRDRLVSGLPRARFVYLKGTLEQVRARLAERTHAFMPASLVESQFADLEEPKDAIVLDISRPVDEMVEDFCRLA